LKFKKKILFNSDNQIWRLLITSTDKLIIETRNTETKQVYFNCIELYSGKSIFSDTQFDEKCWIGIEDTFDDKIIFHEFAKPDMPGHKGISVFDINTQKILWKDEQYLFSFICDGKIYAFKQKFESRDFYALDLETGNIIEELGEDYEKINELKSIAESQKGYDKYFFPSTLSKLSKDSEAVNSAIKEKNIVGEIEYLEYEDSYFLSYHSNTRLKGTVNSFYAIDKEKNKIIFKEVLNTNLELLMPDSFFTYKDLLILLKGKTQVEIYKIDG
jgi:hypothetical protein